MYILLYYLLQTRETLPTRWPLLLAPSQRVLANTPAPPVVRNSSAAAATGNANVIRAHVRTWQSIDPLRRTRAPVPRATAGRPAVRRHLVAAGGVGQWPPRRVSLQGGRRRDVAEVYARRSNYRTVRADRRTNFSPFKFLRAHIFYHYCTLATDTHNNILYITTCVPTNKFSRCFGCAAAPKTVSHHFRGTRVQQTNIV